MRANKQQIWKDATSEQVRQTLDCIENARDLYELEHFPESVRDFVKASCLRIFSGDTPDRVIRLNDGSTPEAVNAVLGIILANKIAYDLCLHFEQASGLQRNLRRIKGAFLHREYGTPLNAEGEVAQ